MQLTGKIAENVGISGVKQIFERDSGLIRRTIWVLSLLSVTVWLALQLYNNILLYLLYPTTISRRIVSPNSIAFPAVTLCNINPMRTRRLFAMEDGSQSSPTVYEAMTEYYRLISPSPGSSEGQTDTRTEKFLEVFGPYLDRISPRDLYTAASHKAEVFIHRCEWGNERCGPDDFIPTLTEAGLCYIFNQNGSLSTDKSGSDGGLRLVLSLEPWDYIRGPGDTIGALIYIHDPSELPTLTTSRGVSVESGTWASIGLEKTRETSLAAPHGNCEDTLLNELPLGTHYTTTNCLINNLYRYIKKTCGCLHFFMPSISNTSYCTFSELVGCVKERLDNMDNATATTNCTNPCNVTRYDLILSKVEMSKRYIIQSRLEDQRDDSDWPDNPDENPIYVQSWAFLNEINPRFTDDITTLADLLENIYHLSDDIITDVSIFQDALNTSDLYQAYDDFRFNLKLQTNIQIGSKSCTQSSNLNGCLTAFIAAEQVTKTKAIKTCSVSEGFFYDIGKHFGHFEEAVAMYLEGSQTEPKKTEMFPLPPDMMVNRSFGLAAIRDEFAGLRANVSSLLGMYDELVSQCKSFEEAIEEYWAESVIGKAEIEDMIRNPGPDLMKVDIGLVDMTYTEIKQMEGYPWLSLIGDVGGTLGLCLGGSVLTLVEIFDVIVTWVFYRDKDKYDLKTERKKEPHNNTDDPVPCPS